jgi:hypothetical protein
LHWGGACDLFNSRGRSRRALSERLGKRKLLAALGYGLAAFTKPVFALATSIPWIVTARFVDRVGKGIRGAPRDALIADLTLVEICGAAFGPRQSLDTVGRRSVSPSPSWHSQQVVVVGRYRSGR